MDNQQSQTDNSQTTISNEPSWRDNLPEDLRELPSLRDFKDVSGLAKSYVHAQSLIGRDKIPVPNSENLEEWNAVYDRLGRPKQPSDYGFKKPDGWNYDWSDELANNFANTAHELGLSTKQAQKLFDFYNGNVANSFQSYNQQRETQRDEAEALLKREWGENYDTSIKDAARALKHYAGEEGIKALESAGLLNNPAIIKMFYGLSNSLKEDSSVGVNQSIPHNSPALAKQEYAELMSDKEFTKRLYDNSHPTHDQAVQKIENLSKLIYGNF